MQASHAAAELVAQLAAMTGAGAEPSAGPAAPRHFTPAVAAGDVAMLAAACAELGEPLLAVGSVLERERKTGRPAPRVIGIGGQRLLVLKPRKGLDALREAASKATRAKPGGSKWGPPVAPRLKAAYWHDLIDATAASANADHPDTAQPSPRSAFVPGGNSDAATAEIEVEMLPEAPRTSMAGTFFGLGGARGRGETPEAETELSSLVLRFALPAHHAGAPPSRATALPPLFNERLEATVAAGSGGASIQSRMSTAERASVARASVADGGEQRRRPGLAKAGTWKDFAPALPSEPHVLELLLPSDADFDALLFSARRASASVWRALPLAGGGTTAGGAGAGAGFGGTGVDAAFGIRTRGDRWSAPASSALRSLLRAAEEPPPVGTSAASGSGSTGSSDGAPPALPAAPSSGVSLAAPGTSLGGDGGGAASRTALDAFSEALGCLYAYHGHRVPRGLRRVLVAQLQATPPVLSITMAHAAVAASLGSDWRAYQSPAAEGDAAVADGGEAELEAPGRAEEGSTKAEARALLVLTRAVLGAAACSAVTAEIRLGPCAGERSLATKLLDDMMRDKPDGGGRSESALDGGIPAVVVPLEAIEACATALRFSPRVLSLSVDAAVAERHASRATLTLADVLPSARARLKHLGLARTGAVDDAAANRLLDAMAAAPLPLASIELSGGSLPSGAVGELTALLGTEASREGLRSLSLAGNKASGLSRELPAQLTTLRALEHLDLAHCGLDCSRVLGALAASPRLIDRLVTLILTGNKLDALSADLLAQIGSKAPHLRALGLASTGMNSAMVGTLLAAVLGGPARAGSAIGLDLSGNHIAEGVSPALAQGLPLSNGAQDSRLTALLLRDSALGEAGVAAVASLCASHGALQHVDVSLNRRSDGVAGKVFGWGKAASADTGAPLAQLLRGCPDLRSLSVGGKGERGKGLTCGRVSLRRLAEAAAEHTALTSLDLSGLKIDEPALAELAAMLPASSSLLNIVLPPPPEAEKAALAARAAIAATAQRNSTAAASLLAKGGGGVGGGGGGGGGGDGLAFGLSTDRCRDPLVGSVERAASFTALAALARAAARVPLPAQPRDGGGAHFSPPSAVPTASGVAPLRSAPKTKPACAAAPDDPSSGAATGSGAGGGSLDAARAALQEEHCSALRDLGVATEAIDEMRREPPPPPCVGGGEGRVRLMSWSILATANAGSGFVVRDVLDAEADAIGPAVDATALAVELLKAGAKSPRGENPRCELNLSVVCDWPRRWARIRETVAAYAPDVLCLQQLDRMEDALTDLRALGYECSLPGAEGYCALAASEMADALHAEDGSPDPDAYVAALTATGLAYAPALSARSSSSGEEDRPGAAVFWRADRWEALTVEFLATARGAGSVTAVVRVLLARASDGAPLAVLSAALPGGATTAAEAARLAELTEPAASGNFDGCFGDTGTPSVRQWFASSAEAAPTALCLDAASAPSRPDKATVWRTLRSARVGSVWDSWYTPEGKLRKPSAPVTTNAILGNPANASSASLRPSHSYGCEDQLFFAGGLKAPKHAYGPVEYKSSSEAVPALLPSLSVPSDHYPLIADLDFTPVDTGAEELIKQVSFRAGPRDFVVCSGCSK